LKASSWVLKSMHFSVLFGMSSSLGIYISPSAGSTEGILTGGAGISSCF
jgi:hypothetical protein